MTCFKEVSHPHPMDKLGLGLELDNSQSNSTASPRDPKEQRKASIEKCIRFLVHATQCHNNYCKQPSCIKMKRVMSHTRECKLMITGKWNQCTVCKQFVLLCISHAKSCTMDRCPVPVCARIKKNLRDQRNQRRVQENRFMQQRIAAQMSALNPNPAAAAAAGTSSSQANVSPPAALNTSPGNPASISSPSKANKDSPAGGGGGGGGAQHPSNPASNKPYMSAPSPATGGPHSVGKGGPRTPNPAGPAPPKASMIATSPIVHGLSPVAAVGGGATPLSVADKPDPSGATSMIQAPSGVPLPQEKTIMKIGPMNDQYMRNQMGRMPGHMMRGPMPSQPEMMGHHHPHPTMNHMNPMYSQMPQQPRVQQPTSNFHHQTAMMNRYRIQHQHHQS